MTCLSDAGHVILSAAARRDDLTVLPLPETLTIKGGALRNVLAGLRKRGLIREIQSEPQQFVVTRDGLIRIGVEPENAGETSDAAAEAAQPVAAEAPADGAAEPEAADGAAAAGTVAPKPVVRPSTKQALLIDLLKRPQGVTVDQIAGRTGWQARKRWGGRPPDAATVAPKPAVRPGTKQALLIDLLKRPEGATVDQIAERTGWMRHTIRGAISGALKKELGLTVEATRVRNVGPNQTGAKGSTTVYRIIQ